MAWTDNLSSYWKLDEASGNRADSHGSNTLVDSNTVTSATGLVYSLAADFEADTSESLATSGTGTGLAIGNADATFAVWIKYETASDNIVAAKGNASEGDFEVRLVDVGDIRFRLRAFGSGGFGGSADVVADSFGALSSATWYLVTVDHDATGDTIGIRVNSGTRDSIAFTTGIYDSGGQFALGQFPGFGIYFDGLMGPAMFWQRLLTSQEHTDLYNGGAGLAYSAMSSVPTMGFFQNNLRPNAFAPGIAR